MSSTPQQLLKRAWRIERKKGLESVLEGIKTRSLSHTNQLELLQRIIQELLLRNITAKEANQITNAVSSRVESDHQL